MDSSFSDRLYTNYIPSDEEAVVISSLLAEPREKLRDLSSEIDQIEANLRKLLKEKDDLNDQLKAHRALLSPARRLPPDVLQEIFHHSLPSDRNPAMSVKEAPVVLGRVCSQWRDIVLATPKLWASIHIAIPTDNINGPVHSQQQQQRLCDNPTRIAAITSWLSRSGACPLSISVYSSRFDPVSNNTIQLYLDALAQFASRWTHIHFSLPHPVWTSFLPRYRDTDVPMLEKIYFDSALGYHGVPGSPGASARRDSGILRAPKLRSISLIQFEPHILHLPFRWAQLTELNLSGTVPSWQPPEGLSVTETLAILALCPNLEYFSVQLSLTGFTPLATGDSGLPKVVLTKLRGLSVTESSNIDSSPFFENLTAPAVRRLKFRRSSPTSYMGVPDLQPPNNPHRPIHIALAMFIRRALQPIEEFELDAFYLTEEDVMKSLSLMPGLRRLSVWSFGASPTSPSPWTTPPGGGAVWEVSLFTFEDKHLRRLTPGGGAVTEEAAAAAVPSASGAGGGSDGEDSEDGSDDDDNNTTTAATQATLNNGGGASTSTAGTATGNSDNAFAWLDDIAAKARARSAQPACLCPLLEDFQCSGAMFSDSAMLDFLRARSSLSSAAPATTTTTEEDAPPSSSTSTSPPLSIITTTSTHLRKCRISFSVGREPSSSTKSEIDRIKTESGMRLDVQYPPVPSTAYYRRYSPYDGLPSVPMMGGPPGSGGGGSSTGGGNGNGNGGGSWGYGSGQPVFMYSAAFH